MADQVRLKHSKTGQEMTVSQKSVQSWFNRGWYVAGQEEHGPDAVVPDIQGRDLTFTEEHDSDGDQIV